ncbi:MAG TPA: hypothetical protein VFE47_27785 [Tepidisphaeraceae bacterium]|jgi:hypothetical protein|nr:hypothetical protein [Tepidisphaeraceae bacterium]
MPVQPLNPLIHNQALSLAEDNRRAQPDITRIFWFPDDQEVRLVELTEQIPVTTEGEALPFYFRAAPQYDLPAPSAIALIRPQEFGHLRLPSGWGDWSDAIEL